MAILQICALLAAFGIGWVTSEWHWIKLYIDALTMAMIAAMPIYFGYKRTDAPKVFGAAVYCAEKAGLKKQLARSMVKNGWTEGDVTLNVE